MPKVNGKNIDPKVYAKRVTQAKKTVAAMDPAVKAKIKDMYPKVTKESIVNKALSPKAPTRAVGTMRKLSDVTKLKAANKLAPKAGKPTAKATAKATVKPTAKATPKSTKTPLSQSEKDFLAGQKYKAKITKKTGVYPNTAN